MKGHTMQRSRATTPALVVIAVAALALAVAIGAGGAAAKAPHRGAACAGHPRGVRKLEVSRMRCSDAVTAVRRGRFELTPGGPLFTTPGFTCQSPVGPPLRGPRFTVCTSGRRSLRFYSNAEPR
jgi:hypothetical protein